VSVEIDCTFYLSRFVKYSCPTCVQWAGDKTRTGGSRVDWSSGFIYCTSFHRFCLAQSTIPIPFPLQQFWTSFTSLRHICPAISRLSSSITCSNRISSIAFKFMIFNRLRLLSLFRVTFCLWFKADFVPDGQTLPVRNYMHK
jgi:hypothetical protein